MTPDRCTCVTWACVGDERCGYCRALDGPQKISLTQPVRPGDGEGE